MHRYKNSHTTRSVTPQFWQQIKSEVIPFINHQLTTKSYSVIVYHQSKFLWSLQSNINKRLDTILSSAIMTRTAKPPVEVSGF